jgi:phage terminase large subunit
MMTNTDISAHFATWREHPAQMVRDLFRVTPEPWQAEALEAFPHHQRICMKASKGVGKTCLEAWLILNFLLTRPHPKIAATAISGANLSDNLWTELALWMNKSPLLSNLFTWTKTRIFANDHPETWWCSARSSPQAADKTQQANTLAGLHADYIMFVLDESGGMPRAIMASAEAALSSCKEGHLIQAGNPTHLEGPLYDACTSERRLWKVIEINGDPDNPKRASRVSIEWARQQIEKYGRDNPYVLVNVFGQFPPSSLNALIGPDEVAASQKRYYRPHEIANRAKIMGVDVARFGSAKSVICQRQGLQCYEYRNIDSTQGAGQVARVWNEWDADACFIDATGGFGAGWLDQLYNLGKTPIGVQFAGEAHEKHRYFNKRSEMYFEAVDWIKRGGALPPSDELLAALTTTTYSFKGDRLILEPKENVEARLGFSLDDADAFVLTFAEPVTAKGDYSDRYVNRDAARGHYDPFRDAGY